MGCCNSCVEVNEHPLGQVRHSETRRLPRRGKPWKSDPLINSKQLEKMREDFWFSTKGTEGKEIIWETLRAAAEADDELSQSILDAAGIVLERGSMEVCYDSTGTKYELPRYVLSNPVNLVQIETENLETESNRETDRLIQCDCQDIDQ